MDVVDLSSARLTRGAVVQVKIVGALGLIDENELDWKLLAISLDDPKAAKINGNIASSLLFCLQCPLPYNARVRCADIADVERELPGAIAEIREW